MTTIAVSDVLGLGLLAVALHAPVAFAGEAPSAPPRSRQDAQRIIEAHGYYGAHDFRLDEAGTWRAGALKYDRRWLIDIDQRGNFASAPAGPRGDLRAPENTGPRETGPAEIGSAADTPREKKPKAKIRLFLMLR